MTTKEAEMILNHLLKTKQGFCFYEYGIVSMGDCEKILGINSEERYRKTCEEQDRKFLHKANAV
jgi:hypothetical protein